MTLYTVKPILTGYEVIKFDTFLNIDHVYHCHGTVQTRLTCDCPANKKPICKHRKLVVLFLTRRREGKGWFFDWDNQQWREPLTSAVGRMRIRQGR